ncbi:MAG: hypothetical protein ABL912_01165 [Novosphingobium sp.]
MTRFGKIVTALAGAIGLLAGLPAAAQQANLYGPPDEQASGGFDGEITLSSTYAKRDRVLISDLDRSGFGASAVIGYRLPAGETTARVQFQAETNKYATTTRGEVEVQQKLGPQVTLSISASGTKSAIVLESLDADQVAVRGGIELRAGSTTFEVYGRHRWRGYNDAVGGVSQGWQGGVNLRQRFGSWHWLELGGSHERIDDNGGWHGFSRSSVSADYSVPIAKRLRLIAGTDYRIWSYHGRWVADNPANQLRRDRLVRPELGLSWGRTKGAYARASGGYDFYESNDPRFSGNGPRLKLSIGYRF